MTKAKVKWLAAFMLVGAAFIVEAGGQSAPAQRADQVQWERLLRSADSVREEDLLNSKSPSISLESSERFSATEAECSANAAALLSINDLATSAAKAVQVGWKEAWNSNVAMFLLRSYAGNRDFLFVCLIDKDGKLQRTRLVRPVGRSKSYAVEIDASHYVYGS